MSNSDRTAYIYVCDTFAGILKETDDGYSFEYDREYLEGENPAPVSLTLPLREEAYTSKTMFAFFDGLIPEGWMLDIVLDHWKLNPKDRFSILLVACGDPIGNVSVRSVNI
ncbi:MAG: HipA N-terminal domain-containing protein [Oscillospiraceae bacterium]|nr:HipA N-terminal domain-containing protein [Oscillospiraceae bacterium]